MAYVGTPVCTSPYKRVICPKCGKPAEEIEERKDDVRVIHKSVRRMVDVGTACRYPVRQVVEACILPKAQGWACIRAKTRGWGGGE